MDVPKLGTTLESPLVKFDAGFDYSFFLYGNDQNVILFFEGRTSALWASQSILYEYLNRTGDKNAFIFNKMSFGVALRSSVRLTATMYFSNGFVNDDFPITVGFP